MDEWEGRNTCLPLLKAEHRLQANHKFDSVVKKIDKEPKTGQLYKNHMRMKDLA
jgi:hypothetical protein